MAYGMVRSFGMNKNVGNLSFPAEGESSGKRPYSKKLANTIDLESRILVAKAYKKTEDVLTQNADKLKTVSQIYLKEFPF